MINRESLTGLVIYVIILCAVALSTKYIFKINLNMYLVSLSFLLIYALALFLENFTTKINVDVLFTVWNLMIILLIAINLAIYWKIQVVLSEILWSLIFQLPYCATLYYYGGIIFSHKFG